MPRLALVSIVFVLSFVAVTVRAQAPRVRVEASANSGPLSQTELERAITRARGALTRCVARSRAVGDVVVRFSVDERGRLAAPAVESSTLDDADASACVVRASARWRFPARRGRGATSARAIVSFEQRVPTTSGGGGAGTDTIGIGTGGSIGHGAGTGHGVESSHGIASARPLDPRPHGALTATEIRGAIATHAGGVSACNPGGLARGRVLLRFVIDVRGAVESTEIVEQPAGREAVGRCLAEAVRRWRFPAPRGNGIVEVTYPFQLGEPEEAPVAHPSATAPPS